ncbi:MAG: energy transducer TonB, partial [Alphaproteobacteria bacterium]|nr:energy transducer TonB [Alphaproteobacteria bacterium]
MRTGASLSSALHAAILVFAWFGLPMLTPEPEPIEESIPISLDAVLSEKTNPPPKGVEMPKPEPKPEPPRPEPPKPEPKPEPPPPPPPPPPP